MSDLIPTTSTTARRLTSRRLRAGLAGLALTATFFAAPSLAGAESVAPSHPVDITNPTPGDDPRPEGPGDVITNPEPGDECEPQEPACTIGIPDPGDDDECEPQEPSCTIGIPDPGDGPDVPEDTTPEDTTPEAQPESDPQGDVEVQPAVVDAPVQATPTFTG